jgi:hypothetical protein
MKNSRVFIGLGLLLAGLTGCNSSTDPASVTQGDSATWINGNFTAIADDGSPLHNRAFRDASGTVWSEAIVNSKQNPGTLALGQQGCNELGGTLPTGAQLDQLAKYLGRDSSYGFHPSYLQDNSGGFARSWDLSASHFWSEPLEGDNDPTSVKAMNGDTGAVTDLSVTDPLSGDPTLASALCVFPKERPKLDCEVYTPKSNPFFSGTGPIYFSKGVGKNVGAAVQLTASDDYEASMMTLSLSNGNAVTQQTYEVDEHYQVSGEVDMFVGLTEYKLICRASRGIGF